MQLCKAPNNQSINKCSVYNNAKCQITKMFLYGLFFFNLMHELVHYISFFGLVFEKYYFLENINLNHYCRHHVGWVLMMVNEMNIFLGACVE